MLHVLGFTGVIGLVAGIFFAAVADVFPAHRSVLQVWGSGLLIGSVALLGLAFPML
jgi:hypothetical protein